MTDTRRTGDGVTGTGEAGSGGGFAAGGSDNAGQGAPAWTGGGHGHDGSPGLTGGKIALAQIDPTVGALSKNARKILEFAARARDAGARLVVFPEMALLGYPPRDLVEREAVVAANLRLLHETAAKLTDIQAIVGFVDRNTSGAGKPLHNAAALIGPEHPGEDGRVLARVHKSLLPTYDVFDEVRWFEPSARVDPMETAAGLLGVSICEDMWVDKESAPGRYYRTDPIEALAAARPRALLNISASPFSQGKRAVRLSLITGIARRHRLPVLFVNQVGGNDSLLFDGASTVVDAEAQVIARARSFAEDLLVVDLAARTGSIALAPESDEEEVFEALVLGLRDYVAKSGFTKVVLGLSGGIDSALTAVIAAAAVGPRQVIGVSMPSRYSSDGASTDARTLAENLGLDYRAVPIEPVHRAFLETLAPQFSGLAPDVTEENVQARIRGTILMAISNKLGALVLSTGNKSELACGYCTLYGDMCGGLAVISDLPKMMVYRVSRWVNREREIIPRASIEKPPSAELRPDQKDQDTLPPYDLLDQVLALYVEDGLDADAIVKCGFDPPMVARIVRMVDRNEYKRQQAAPGLRVTWKAFGMGRRYPIARGYEP